MEKALLKTNDVVCYQHKAFYVGKLEGRNGEELAVLWRYGPVMQVNVRAIKGYATEQQAKELKEHCAAKRLEDKLLGKKYPRWLTQKGVPIELESKT